MVAIIACEFAVGAAGLHEAVIDSALNTLRQGTSIPPTLKSQLDTLTTRWDEQYSDLQSRDAPEATAVFGWARAAAALSFASLSPAIEAVCDSLYEASATVDDPSQLFKRIRETL